MSSTGNTLRLRERLADKFGERELRPQRFRATMGDGTGAVVVPGKPNYVYVRRLGRGLIEECLNNKAAIRDGLPVIAGYSHESPEILQILEVDWPSFAAPGDYSYIQHHHDAHELHNVSGGDDVVWVQSQQFMPLLVYPTDPAGMTLNVFSGWYPWVSGWHYFENVVTAGFGGYVAGLLPAEAMYVLISIDGATEVLQYTAGATFPVFMPPVDAENMVPVPPVGSIPIGAVYLVSTTTELDWDNLFDMRLFNQPVGGSVTPAPHALLDVTVHSDTVTNAPSEGSLIVGNATPLWDELVHPGAAGYALVSGAADTVWDQTPTWTGSHTFDAGLTIPAGQGIVLTDDTSWIGLGPAAGRLVFEDIVGDEARFENCTYVGIDNVLRHNGDPDTYMIFSPDFCGFRVGGVDFLYMDENGVDEFEVNPGGADIDFIVQAVGVADALLVQGSDGQITLGALTAGFAKSSAAGVLSVAAEVALAELAGYVRGSIIRGGAADWEALALAGAAGYALISTATDVVWDQTPAWTGEHSFAAGIAFTGASGANEITIPDNTAIALELLDAGGLEYMRVVSTDANPYFLIDPAGAGINTGIRTAAPVGVLSVIGGEVHIVDATARDLDDTFMTYGLMLNQGAADNEIISFKSSDVAHGITALTETDTYGYMQKASAVSGGLNIIGATEDTMGFANVALVTNDVVTKTTASMGAIVFQAYKKAGATVGAMGANANLFVVTNQDLTRLILNAEGDLYLLLSAATAAGLRIVSGATETAVFTYNTATGENKIGGIQAYAFPTFWAGNQERARILVGGNFGIGTIVPPSLCSVDGDLALVDGMAAPGTSAGWAKIYVDTADGDLKVKFGDGHVAVIAADS